MSKRKKNPEKRPGIITSGGNIPRPGQSRPNVIMLTQPRRFGIDIADYTAAIRTAENVDVTRNFAASLFRNIKYFTLRKLYLCRKWMQKRLQKTTTTGITLPNFDFLA